VAVQQDTDRAVTPRRPGFARWPVLGIAAALAALLIAFADRYGYHRDELYFLACGRHLAWGYPDQPPLVPLLAWLAASLDASSLVLLRLPSALASAVLVIVTGLLARELGSGRAAQVLAAASISVAAVVLGSGHLLSTTTFGLPVWAGLCWLIVRILRTGDDRLWLAAGVLAGVGLFASDLVAFLMFAVLAGLAIAGPRRPLRSGWLYAGGLIALVMWLPYLVWQAQHGWPELAISRSIASGGSGTSAPRWALVPEQLVLVSPYLAAVWLTGLVRLLRGGALRWCRALGVAYLVLVVVFLVTGGKPYYLAGMFPLLLAAGAQPVVDWARRGRRWLRQALVGAALVLSLTSLPIVLPIVPVGSIRHTPIVALNYDAGETIGWPAYVREIGAVYAALPPAQRASAIVLGSNYGEAGAVDRFGRADGLPAAYGVQNGYSYWGPPPASAATAVAVGFSRGTLAPACGTLRLAGRLSNHVGVADDEQGAPVWVCSALRAPWPALWPRLRDLG
jgi:Dolichyl-phosphate-mannose-protein mannosyltransferase